MIQYLEGFKIYGLINEYQIYDGKTLRRKVWKCGQRHIDAQRLAMTIAELITEVE